MPSKWIRILSVLFGCFASVVVASIAIEYFRRLPERLGNIANVGVLGLNVKAIGFGSLYYDAYSIVENKVPNLGSVFLKVRYPGYFDDLLHHPRYDETIISRLHLKGKVLHADGTIEKFSKDCVRHGTTKLDLISTGLIDTWEMSLFGAKPTDKPDTSPVCFIGLERTVTLPGNISNHSITVGSNDYKELKNYIERKTSIELSSAHFFIRKRPTILEIKVRKLIGVAGNYANSFIETISGPFKRI